MSENSGSWALYSRWRWLEAPPASQWGRWRWIHPLPPTVWPKNGSRGVPPPVAHRCWPRKAAALPSPRVAWLCSRGIWADGAILHRLRREMSISYGKHSSGVPTARGVPGVHLRGLDLGPSEAFRACLSPGVALEWLWGAEIVLGRPGDHFFKKELFGQWTSLRVA